MTDKSQRYAVGNSGPVFETNDELDAIVLDADAQAERMSFEPYTMTPAGLLYNDDTIAGLYCVGQPASMWPRSVDRG